MLGTPASKGRPNLRIGIPYLSLDQDLNAVFPAPTAASTSSGVATGTSQFGFLFEGLMLWRVLDVETERPSMVLEKLSNWIFEACLALLVLESLVVAEGAILTVFLSNANSRLFKRKGKGCKNYRVKS